MGLHMLWPDTYDHTNELIKQRVVESGRSKDQSNESDQVYIFASLHSIIFVEWLGKKTEFIM
jgi:hypothetical protein